MQKMKDESENMINKMPPKSQSQKVCVWSRSVLPPKPVPNNNSKHTLRTSFKGKSESITRSILILKQINS